MEIFFFRGHLFDLSSSMRHDLCVVFASTSRLDQMVCGGGRHVGCHLHAIHRPGLSGIRGMTFQTMIVFTRGVLQVEMAADQ